MQLTPLTFKSIRARAVVLKLRRPVVARIATITEWPLILIDLSTEEGIVGRSYLEPYTIKTMRYLIPALQDFGVMLRGRRVAPVELYDLARKSLHFVGYQGLSMIAVAGLDMAAWDALVKVSGVPLCVLLGGSVGPVKAYNSNGLWLQAPEVVAAEATPRDVPIPEDPTMRVRPSLSVKGRGRGPYARGPARPRRDVWPGHRPRSTAQVGLGRHRRAQARPGSAVAGDEQSDSRR
jgi:hypothetical protein